MRVLLAAILAASCTAPAALAVDPLDAVVDRLKVEEGFRGLAYRDSRGVLTIGYGTSLEQPLTPVEAEYLLRSRLELLASEFQACWPPVLEQPTEIQSGLYDAAYQLGAGGLCGFGTMLGLIASGRYAEAADDALGTRWAEETPARAQALAEILRSAGS